MRNEIKNVIMPSAVPGKFKLITTYAYSDGSGSFDYENIVYETREMAYDAGEKAAKGNVVFVSMVEHEVEGKIYYSPGMNVWH